MQLTKKKIEHRSPLFFHNARLVRFVAPIYDYWEDDDGYEQRECTNEERRTRHWRLVRNVYESDKALYFRRYTVDSARQSLRYCKQYARDNRVSVACTRWGNYVCILPVTEYKQCVKKMVDRFKNKEYNKPLREDKYKWLKVYQSN